MEYLVLARKYRPQNFEDVVGQEHVVKTLCNAVSQNRIAHAFIFSGPRGIGKTSVARILAKALNCEAGPTPAPCNVCTNCREITDGIAIDVHEIDGASNRGIDEIRELREFIKFASVSSRYKIYIIDEVHMLTKEAFNALLKTLEEPPPHVIFIFATTETQKVPATILSRCQCFDFRRISLKQIANQLKKIADTEGIRISDTALGWIAEAGDGSLRDAQSILDQAISFAGFDIKDTDIEELLGKSDRRFLVMLSEAVLKKDAGKCLYILEDAYYAGLDMKYFYQRLLEHFRNLLLTKIVDGQKALALLDINNEEMTALETQVKDVSRETLQCLLDILMTEEESVSKSHNPRLNLETTLIRMAYLEPMIPIQDILSQMEEMEKRLSSEVAPPATQGASEMGKPAQFSERTSVAEKNTAFTFAPEKSNAQEPKGADPEMKTSDPRWENYKNFVKKYSPVLYSKIEPGEFLGLENGCLRIGFAKNYIFLDDINGKSQRDQLNELSTSFFHEEVMVKIESLEHDSNSCYKTNNNAQRFNDIQRDALKHPMVQKIIDLFEGAEIREVIPRKTP
jgi:DNA polymerase-3 subunit gamma/tau